MLTQRSPEVQRFMRERDAVLLRNSEETKEMVRPHLPAADVLPDGSWAGQACFIIGGGPSLTGFDFNRLHGRGKVIVINKGFVRVPLADVLFFMDYSNFYMRLKRGILGPEAVTAWRDFKGVKVFLNLRGRVIEDAHSVRSIGSRGYSTSLRLGLYHGNNTGYGAIGLALCMKADPIYLLGYDMKHAGRVTHWHGGYSYRQPESVLAAYKKEINGLAEMIHKRGRARVINLNPASALTCFPFGDVDQVLA